MGADLVKEARKRAGLTQRELAERAGTTQSAIARLESGRVDPGFEAVRRLMRLAGFNLLVALDPYDDSELQLAMQLLQLPLAERLDVVLEAANAAMSRKEATGTDEDGRALQVLREILARRPHAQG